VSGRSGEKGERVRGGEREREERKRE